MRFAARSLPGLTAQTSAMEAVGLFVGILFLILIGAAAVFQVRKRYFQDDSSSEALSIEDYRRLMEEGSLAPQEFERIRRQMEGIEKPKTDDRIQSPSPPSD
ncbi:MAG: hypothetical protein K2X38_13095 [Gemmataceae bacterium]|nr:hypothetical protein [Gemmataceae bacterium]